MTHPPSQNTLVSLVRPGELIAGKYRIDRALGQGAMGVVMAATHVELRQEVAIKLMLGSASRDPTLVERFRREAQVSARIRSEHVARVMDVGKLDNGTPYIVMEFLQGCDLAIELEQRGPLPLRDVADFLLQASEALSEAHALGIVHRDLKPSNFFLLQRRDGSRILKILDFGISKMGDASISDVALTATHALMGSPLYMAPEQIRNSKNVDARSDIWSLGVVMYELLTGRTPFEAEQVGGLLAAIVTDEPPSLRSISLNIPYEIEALVNRCLQKDPNKRLANVSEFARALKPFASSAGKVVADRISRTSLRPVGEATAQPPSSDPIQIPMQTGFGAAFTKNPVGRSALPWFGGVIALALASAVAVFWFKHSTIDPKANQLPLSPAAQSANVEQPEPATPLEAHSVELPPVKEAPEPEPAVAIEQLPVKEIAKVAPPEIIATKPKVIIGNAQRPRLTKPLTTANSKKPTMPTPAATSSNVEPAPQIDPLAGRK